MLLLLVLLLHCIVWYEGDVLVLLLLVLFQLVRVHNLNLSECLARLRDDVLALQEALPAAAGHHRYRVVVATATGRRLDRVCAVLRVQPLVLVEVAELREHRPADVALETDRRDGVGDRLVDHNPAVHGGRDARDAVLELVDQRVVVAERLRDVARFVVVGGGQLGEVDRVGALKGKKINSE